MTAEQRRLLLTPHPLQRVGGYALVRLADRRHLSEMDSEAFDAAVATMTRHAVAAALVRDSKLPEGFWLKCSMSFFPNSKMNHLSNPKRDSDEIRERVAEWRAMPEPAQWPAAVCVLCGRQAVGFYGKMDVPLAESDLYRNTTPRGHAGMALCWPCLCSFYALPYGCRLSGGPSIAVHSWDDDFLRRRVHKQVSANVRLIDVGGTSSGADRELAGLKALYHYEHRLTAGVQLVVFSNNNRGQTLDLRSVEQPLAEWLRRMARTSPGVFAALVRAHRQPSALGVVNLARDVFRQPGRVVGSCARYLIAGAVGERALHPRDVAVLPPWIYDYAIEVLGMDDKDMAEIRATGHRVAALLSRETSGGKLRNFYVQTRKAATLRAWLQRQAVDWTLRPADGAAGPLVTTHGFALLFDPELDSNAWHHRQLLLVAVLEGLHERGWRPDDGAQVAQDLDDEMPADEQTALSDEAGRDGDEEE